MIDALMMSFRFPRISVSRFCTAAALCLLANLALGQDFAPPASSFSNPNNKPPLTPASSPRGTLAQVSDAYVDVLDCAVHLIDDIDVPAREAGLLIEVNADEGQVVKQGELLARIDDQLAKRQLDEAQLKLSIATKKAEDTTDIDAADKKQKLLNVMYERKARLLKDSSVSQEDVETARFQKETAFFEFLKAKRDKDLAVEESKTEEVKLNAAKDSIVRHQLISPIDGHVFQVFKESGEWVAAGETVMRVARMNKLKATGLVDATRYSAQDIANRNVVITVRLPREQTIELPGKIVYIDFERKEAGVKFQVWAEIENKQENGQWLLNPDDYVSMRILLK